MRFAILALVLALVLPACSRSADTKVELKELHVADVVALQQKGAKPTLLDANGPGFRQKNGVIPGAKLLSSFDKYDVAKELPADKTAPLVFYCVNAL